MTIWVFQGTSALTGTLKIEKNSNTGNRFSEEKQWLDMEPKKYGTEQVSLSYLNLNTSIFLFTVFYSGF